MKPHFSEADLLETYYTRPGQSLPVMMHLADCAECAARYERLESKMRGLSSCHRDDEKPETFWARQRISVMRKIDRRRERSAAIARVTRVAAAAMLVMVLSGLLMWKRADAPATRPVVNVVQTAAIDDAAAQRNLDDSNPWQSEELKDYSSMVDWESWVEKNNNGDHS
ncbi:MAG TPA: hypothetical protein VM733_19350 [Thermoanaerobaculia bacterium]|nr:hypothetical protein [Thermoanaerobaculia bacterium]